MNTTVNIPQAKIGPAGTWTITEAKINDKTLYSGTVQIHPMSGIYAVSWLTTLGDYPGIAFFEDDRLFVGCGSGGSYGVTLYNINKDGTLDGKWTTSSSIDGAIDIEKAYGGTPDRVEGTYQVSGKMGKTGNYQGILNIHQLEQTYQLSWSAGAEYRGVGLRVGEKLIAAWGEGDVFALHYHIQGNRAYGQWAVTEQSFVAEETLDRIC